MSRRSLGASTLRAAFLASASTIALPAAAQLDPGVVPPAPVRQSVDANGVDVIQGTFVYSSPSVSIGPSYPEGLSFTYSQRGRGWLTSTNAAIFQSGSTYTVSINGVSDSFTKAGSTFTPTEGNGATLTDAGGGNLTYVSHTGVNATFAINDFTLPAYSAAYARATSITFPSGVRLDFTYAFADFCRGGMEGGVCPTQMVTALRLQSVTNTNGYQLKFTYASNVVDPPTSPPGPWQQVTQVQAINNAVEYCAPAANSCTLTGSWPKLTIGASSVTDAMNRTTSYTTVYNTNNSLTTFKVKRPGASTDNIVVSYDSAGRVQSVQNEGVTYTYSYVDAASPATTRTTTVTDPNSKTKVYVGDKATSLLSSFKDELNRTTLYTWDPGGKGYLTDVEYPEHNKVHSVYDTRGNVIQTTLISKTAGTPADIVTSAAFPMSCVNPKTCNQPTTTTDARGKVTNYTYDPNSGGIGTVTLPKPTTGSTIVRPKVTYTYEPFQAYYKNNTGSIVASGRPTYRLTTVAAQACTTTTACASDPQETEVTIDYGPQTAGTANNLLPVTQSSGHGSLIATTTTTWDAIGNPTYVDGPLPGVDDVTRTLYDADRAVIGVIGPDPDGAVTTLRNRAVRLTYNDDGQITLTELGRTLGQSDTNWNNFVSLRQIDTTYDNRARPLKQRVRIGSTAFSQTEWGYTNLGQLHCTAVRMNVATFNDASPNACVLRTTGAFGPDRVSRIAYTDAGEVTSVGVAYNTPASATAAAYTYTDNGLVQTVKDGNNNLTTYAYDGFDRRTTTFYPSPTTPNTSSTTDYELLGYDEGSRVISLRTRSADAITLGYDDLGRLTSKVGPATYTNNSVGYAYDNLGRQTSSTGNGQPTYTSAYDALGRATSDTSSTNGAFTWEYDLAGRRTRQTWGDGFYVAYDYLTTGEMSAVRENGATSGVGVLATYGYDLQGRRTSIVRGNGASTSYGYADASTGLDTPWLTTLAHNVAGTTKDVSTAFTYNPAGQIATLQRNNDLYAYTAATNFARGYTVNGLNQATAYTGKTLSYDANGNTTSDGTSTYAYTPENQLKSGPAESGLVYDGTGALYKIGSEGVILRSVDGEVATEHDAVTGAIENRYVTGASTDEPLVWYGGSGTTDRHWLLADERGSIVASTNASGVASVNTYDEYGIPATGNIGRFGYTGQYWLPSVGLWYYKARMYAPGLGRFMQTDPIGYGGGMNLYAYVGGDPLNATDPFGLEPGDEVVVTANVPPKPQNGAPIGLPSTPGGSTTRDRTAADAREANQCVRDDQGRCVPDVVVTLRRNTRNLYHTALITIEVVDRAFGLVDQALDLVHDLLFPPACCFTAGTLVSTPSGLKAIETLKVGDLVTSRSDQTGKTAAKPVVRITPAHERRIWTVSISYKDKDGRWMDERYETTDDHPWRTLSNEWVTSASLKHGQVLARENGTATVAAVVDTKATKLTYNLEIADLHTYFVGKAKAWVHNSCNPHGIPDNWSRQPGRKAGHVKFVNPSNPHDYVRIKPDGTLTQVRNGMAYDVYGNRVPLDSPGAHGINPGQFVFRP